MVTCDLDNGFLFVATTLYGSNTRDSDKLCIAINL